MTIPVLSITAFLLLYGVVVESQTTSQGQMYSISFLHVNILFYLPGCSRIVTCQRETADKRLALVTFTTAPILKRETSRVAPLPVCL